MKARAHEANGAADGPGPVTAAVKEERAARHARALTFLFMEEALGSPDRHARRRMLRDLTALLFSRALDEGGRRIAPSELCEEIEQLRAAHVPAARIGG